MRSMISWRITAIGGWAGRPPVGSRLKQNVSDLSDDEERQAGAAEVSCFIDISTAVHKARLDPNHYTFSLQS
jgi:hypothetical protein